jgi:hypothetical protein
LNKKEKQEKGQYDAMVVVVAAEYMFHDKEHIVPQGRGKQELRESIHAWYA